MKIKNTKTKKNGVVTFPAKIVAPVANFLKARLAVLEKRKKVFDEEDPFKNTSRVSDNAATDIEADEQFGHARVSALKSEVSRKIIQTRKALTRIKVGKYGICEDCGNMIDTDRLMVYPEATLCAKDAARREK